MSSSHGRLPRGLAGLIVVAVCLRIGLIVVDGARLDSDPDGYVRLGAMLAGGKGFVAADGQTPTAFRPVLYPLLLAAPMAGGASARFAVILWNLLAIVLLLLAVNSLSRLLRLSPIGTAIACMAAALDPLLLRYSTEPMTENVSAALLTAALCLVVRFVVSANASPKDSPAPLAVKAGVLLGLSVLCRPVALFTCMLLPIPLLLLMRSLRTALGTRRWVIAAFLPSMIAAVITLPWIARNGIQFGGLVPATTHGGYTLLLANNSVFYDRVVAGKQTHWDGESLTDWQSDLHRQQHEDGISPADERASDRWMYDRAFEEIRSHPEAFRQSILLRWRRFWGTAPVAAREQISPAILWAVRSWYWVGAAGLFLSVPALRRRPDLWLLWTAVASFLLVHSFYWTNTRMRAPLTGLLVALAVVGWSCIFPKLSNAPAQTPDSTVP